MCTLLESRQIVCIKPFPLLRVYLKSTHIFVVRMRAGGEKKSESNAGAECLYSKFKKISREGERTNRNSRVHTHTQNNTKAATRTEQNKNKKGRHHLKKQNKKQKTQGIIKSKTTLLNQCGSGALETSSTQYTVRTRPTILSRQKKPFQHKATEY